MRTVLRVLTASFVGYAIVALGSAAGAAAAAVWFPQSAGQWPTTAFQALSVAAAFVAAMAGGYAAGRLAPAGWRLATVALLIAAVLGFAVVRARLGDGSSEPPGFAPLVGMLSVIGTWAGAMVERAIHARSRR